MAQPVSRRRALASGAGFVAAGLTGGCLVNSGSGADEPATVVIGSKTFTENRILGQMLIELLREQTDLNAVNELSFARSTMDVWTAFKESEIDAYWEYTGTMWLRLPPERSERISDPGEMYSRSKELMEENHNASVLQKAPFTNSYGLITTQEWVETTGIETVSGLISHINQGNTDVSAAVGEAGYDREDAWPGLLDYYGLDEETRTEWENESVSKVLSGSEYPQLRSGEVSVVLRFTTDAQIARNSLHVLEDDKGYWPAYSPAPLVRDEILETSQGIRDRFDKIGPAIDGEREMRRLNGKVEFQDQSVREVAREFLSRSGLI